MLLPDEYSTISQNELDELLSFGEKKENGIFQTLDDLVSELHKENEKRKKEFLYDEQGKYF